MLRSQHSIFAMSSPNASCLLLLCVMAEEMGSLQSILNNNKEYIILFNIFNLTIKYTILLIDMVRAFSISCYSANPSSNCFNSAVFLLVKSAKRYLYPTSLSASSTYSYYNYFSSFATATLNSSVDLLADHLNKLS